MFVMIGLYGALATCVYKDPIRQPSKRTTMHTKGKPITPLLTITLASYAPLFLDSLSAAFSAMSF